ncbi:MAG: pilus assembly protein PilM [Kiritimatiellae bacterium]|nr:pilus assembly protein PilM [Kiritimatiellia bacterium]
MGSFKEIIDKFKRGPSDIVALDITDTGVAAVRMRTGNEGVSVLAADILPPVQMPEDPADTSGPSLIEVPPHLAARHAALTIPGEDAIVKILNLPGQFDAEAEDKLTQNLGLDDPDAYRIAYKLIIEGHSRGESRLLAVAIPDDTSSAAVQTLSVGLPVPYSLEIAGLCALSAFLHGPGAEHAENSIGAMDFGENSSTFAIFNKGVLALIRRFNAGSNTILEKIQETLGVDKETAQGIMTDGAFDISQAVGDVLEPLVKQIMVSRDFVERREDCQVSKIYVSGGLVSSRDALDELKSSVGIDVESWDPFTNMTVLPDAIPEHITGKEWRFAAPVGAALAAFEER